MTPALSIYTKTTRIVSEAAGLSFNGPAITPGPGGARRKKKRDRHELFKQSQEREAIAAYRAIDTASLEHLATISPFMQTINRPREFSRRSPERRAYGATNTWRATEVPEVVFSSRGHLRGNMSGHPVRPPEGQPTPSTTRTCTCFLHLPRPLILLLRCLDLFTRLSIVNGKKIIANGFKRSASCRSSQSILHPFILGMKGPVSLPWISFYPSRS